MMDPYADKFVQIAVAPGEGTAKVVALAQSGKVYLYSWEEWQWYELGRYRKGLEEVAADGPDAA